MDGNLHHFSDFFMYRKDIRFSRQDHYDLPGIVFADYFLESSNRYIYYPLLHQEIICTVCNLIKQHLNRVLDKKDIR